MAIHQSANLCDNLSLVLIHAFGSVYFISKFIYLSLILTQRNFSDELVVFSFLLTVVTFSFLSIRTRTSQQPPEWEQAGLIILAAISTISFVYFQFYFESWSLAIYVAMFTLAARKFACCCLQSKANFPIICLTYGILALIPIIHATFWPSACRMPMVAHFIAYLSLNAIGGLGYILQIPERFKKFGCVFTRDFMMHAYIIIAAIFFWQKLSAACASGAIQDVDQCKKLTW
jgi:hypothetical protein